jgi:hypothetical protein
MALLPISRWHRTRWRLKGERSLYQAIADDDWVLILNAAGHITRVGRVLRVRSDLDTTTIYFDRRCLVIRRFRLASHRSPRHPPEASADSMDGFRRVAAQGIAQDHRRRADH